jgi:hypothetical protein
VDAADPACAQEANPRRPADGERPADRCRADDTLDGRGGEVARPDLASTGVEPLQLGLGQPDHDLAVEDADRRRDGARLAHAPLRLEADGDALSGREAMGHERRLERDDSACLAYLVRDADHAERSMSTNGISPERSKKRR